MKIAHEVVIDCGREEVWKTFDNPDNLMKWQPTLKKFEHKSGVQGRVGAVSELVYEENGRKIVMSETVTSRKEPEEFSGEYKTPQGVNRIKNQFIKLEGNQTRWLMELEVIVTSLMWKIITPFIKGMIRKRIVADMERFKALAEGR